VTGVRGAVLATATESRGHPTNRDVVGDFTLSAPAVIVTSGGIGGNHDLVRAAWPDRLGTPPDHLTTGVPAYVDGRMIGIVEAAGGSVINRDRMWHYVEGIHNWAPIWPGHAIRILPGPSAMWFDGNGRRLPAPYFPGFDTLGTLAHLRQTGHDHSWFVLTQKVIEKEFALSGSEQNPDLTGKSVRQVLGRVRPGAPKPVQAFVDHGEDFVTATTIQGLVERMNTLTPGRTARRRRHRAAGGRTRPQPRQRLLQGRPDHRDPRRPEIPRRQAHPHRDAAQVPRPRQRSTHRRSVVRRHAKDVGGLGDRPREPSTGCRRRTGARPLCGG
jgi:predicted oxidoreductase